MLEKLIEQLETDGYCKLPQVYSPEQMAKALKLVQTWSETKDSIAEDTPFLNRNTQIVYTLQNKDYYFLELLFSPPEIQKLMMHFLNDVWYKQIPQTEPNYILRSYMARSSNTALPLHIDSFVPYLGSYVFSIQVAIILEDQSEVNGSTLFVPGSHKSGQYVEQSALKDAVSSESKAGDVVIWDSRLWHGASENKSGGTRWAMIATFARWWLKQFMDIPQSLPQEIYEKLTDSQKAILGFCSIPNKDETQGIDMKKGYDSLLPDVSGYRS